jgi:hypothetical protein
LCSYRASVHAPIETVRTGVATRPIHMGASWCNGGEKFADNVGPPNVCVAINAAVAAAVAAGAARSRTRRRTGGVSRRTTVAKVISNARTAGRDGIHPGPQRRPVLIEPIETPPGPHQRLLHGVLRLERRAQHPVAVPDQLDPELLQLKIYPPRTRYGQAPRHCPLPRAQSSDTTSPNHDTGQTTVAPAVAGESLGPGGDSGVARCSTRATVDGVGTAHMLHIYGMDPTVGEWIRAHVDPAGPIETVHSRPWATAMRVPTAHGVVWFKACAPVQGFEPRLSAELFARWPDRVAEVLGHNVDRAWLLLGDAGRAVGAVGNPPESWLAALPLYAELQRGETVYAGDHVRHGVPNLRLARLPDRFEDLVRRHLPLADDEITRMRRFTRQFTSLCEDLSGSGVPETVQHDDLHMANLYAHRDRLRVLDWGDSSIAHPFASLVVTFRFLEQRNRMLPEDPWFGRLRDAYLEPWGPGLRDTFTLAMRVGAIAHAVAWLRQRDALPQEAQPEFDKEFSIVLRRAIAHMA